MDKSNSTSFIYLDTGQAKLNQEDYSCYTQDVFRCCICQDELTSIDNYVTHMTLVEHCVLVLCPATSIKDLLLPRFIKKPVEQKLKEENNSDGISTIKDKIFCNNQGDLEVINESDLLQAVEVETGNKTRWKCKLCCLTFSRQAAFINHHRLQHSSINELNIIEEKINNDPISKVKVNKEIMPKPEVPVKHIIAFESKPIIDNLHTIKKQTPEWDDNSCDQCGQIFKTSRNLKTHISVVHSSAQPYVCEYANCGQAFKTKGSYIRHQRRHTGERPYKCLDCGRMFRESGALVRHKKSREFCRLKSDVQLPRYGMTKPIGKPNIDRQPDTADLGEDEDMVSDEVKTKKLSLTSPPEESKAAIRAQILKSRSSMAVNIKEEKITLSISNKPLKDKTSPKRIRCKTEPTPDLAVSEIVQRNVKFENAGDEEQLPTEEDSKPEYLPSILRTSFVCPVCCQSYCKKAHLDHHLKKHLSELNLRCNQCSKMFTSDQALIRHLISHSSVRQYECCHCQKTFKLPSHAKYHLLSHTSEKTHSCPECGRFFKSVSSRNAHRKIHTGIKSYSCIQCDKAFVTKASLERHYRIHSGDTPFHCSYCGQGFKEKGTLKRHLNHRMPCSRQAQLRSNEIGIELQEEKLTDRWMGDLDPFFENSSNFNDSESDILNGSVSPSLASLLDEVHSPLFSSSMSISSRQSFNDDDDDDDSTISSNLLSTAIALSQDNDNICSIDNSAVLLPFNTNSFQIPEEEAGMECTEDSKFKLAENHLNNN